MVIDLGHDQVRIGANISDFQVGGHMQVYIQLCMQLLYVLSRMYDMPYRTFALSVSLVALGSSLHRSRSEDVA